MAAPYSQLRPPITDTLAAYHRHVMGVDAPAVGLASALDRCAPIHCNLRIDELLYASFDKEETCDEVLPGVLEANRTGESEEPLAKKIKTEPTITSDRTQSRQNKKRARIRINEKIKVGYSASKKTQEKHTSQAAPIHTQMDTARLPAARGAYTALNKPVPEHVAESPDIAKLIEEGFRYIAVDVSDDTPRPILDKNGYVIGYIGYPPKDRLYSQGADELFDIIMEESDGHFCKDELSHKRGDFPAVNFGFTLPNGFQDPIQLDEKRHKHAINRIRNSLGFAQISSFQNGLFAFWNPAVYTYQKTRVEQVLANDASLTRNAATTVYPTAACNFRNVCCWKHRDTQNCPFSWCAITALGRFDHTKGGHLILWELKLIIEFPHGYTILIPSATITHSNSPVAAGDTRVSVTQYCAGSVLRYADNLCHTDKNLRQKNEDLYRKNSENKLRRWKEALLLLRTLKDLRTKCSTSLPELFK